MPSHMHSPVHISKDKRQDGAGESGGYLRRLRQRPGAGGRMAAGEGAAMRAGILMPAVLMAGCAGAPRVETVEVRVPVPVECREPVPARPAMPTEALQPRGDGVRLRPRGDGRSSGARGMRGSCW